MHQRASIVMHVYMSTAKPQKEKYSILEMLMMQSQSERYFKVTKGLTGQDTGSLSITPKRKKTSTANLVFLQVSYAFRKD